jgi:hypothetical protein
MACRGHFPADPRQPLAALLRFDTGPHLVHGQLRGQGFL